MNLVGYVRVESENRIRLHELVSECIAAAENNIDILQDDTERHALYMLKEFYKDNIDPARLNIQTDYLGHPISNPFPGYPPGFLRFAPMDASYEEHIDYRGKEFTTDLAAEYLGLLPGTLNDYLSTAGFTKGNDPKLPAYIDRLEDLYLVGLGGRGKRGGNLFRRGKGQPFDCLNFLMNVVPAAIDPSLEKRYHEKSIKDVLLTAKAMLKEGKYDKVYMSQIYYKCGIYSSKEYGLIIDCSGDEIMKVFERSNHWVNGGHASQFECLRGSKRITWKKLDLGLPELSGYCIALPWHRIVLDLV